MSHLNGQAIVVAGGTGNMGGQIVRALLEQGAVVAVPSRSTKRALELRAHLHADMSGPDLSRLTTLVGDIGDERGSKRLVDEIVEKLGPPSGVVATLGGFVPAPSLLAATSEQMSQAFEGYPLAHFTVARAFLPLLTETGGRYVFINGPLAFEPWKDSGAGLVSVATAAQHMLFRSLAQELEGTPAEVMELVVYAFVRERRTQPGSPVPAEAVGAYAAHLLSGSGTDLHGQTVHLRSLDVMRSAGLLDLKST